MATKQEILTYAKQNGFIYPKEKVILLFSLCGGAVGGFILGLIIALFFIANGDIDNDIKIFNILTEFLSFMVGIIGISALIGFIPALLTGIYLAVTEFIISNKKDYLSLLLIGGIITIFVCLIILMFFIITNEGIFDLNGTLILLILFLIGGLSAMICGKLFLPKLTK